MSQVTIFCGGSIGSDPRSAKTWSGSCLSLVTALEVAGILDCAIGVNIGSFGAGLLRAKNFHRNRTVWRTHYYFDPAYRRALTHAAGRIPVDSRILMQIGHMFSLPDVFPQKECISYHDGNLCERINSGFGFEGVSRQRIDQALRYEERVAGQMTAVFTFSEYLRQSFISDYHLPPTRVINVGGGVNLAAIPSVDLTKDYTAKRILFVGRDFVRKGGVQLLEAFQIVRETLPAAELHIAGPANLYNLPPGVIVHGHLSKEDPEQSKELENLFRDSTLFVLPSLYEPFGIAPLEAMLYQLPCLVTDAWAFREFVSPGFNGDRVTKGAVDELASKMLDILSDPERLALMGRNGRDLVLRNYTWPSVAERIATAIERC
jgi:glycosyltransferase involved in cell wall biosynthesis